MTAMTEDRAKDIIELHKHLDRPINDPFLHTPMDLAIYSYIEAKGYLAGLSAVRERTKQLQKLLRMAIEGTQTPEWFKQTMKALAAMEEKK